MPPPRLQFLPMWGRKCELDVPDRKNNQNNRNLKMTACILYILIKSEYLAEYTKIIIQTTVLHKH